VDLPKGTKSGLKDAWETLHHISEIGFIHLTEKDIVRHTLVQKIVEAYENHA
ncbi:MAG: PhoH family protein, partial [Thermicanus sp.]|nr:PhoH family protein [Thermicanus sp.]